MPVLSSLSKFQEVFDALNERQKEAVQHIEGPVLVIAGPGTGKTQILAARIARILLETDVFPENILCLTYTEAGTVAMRKRLLEFIGADAYRVNISTFHGFCNQVIQDNLETFGFRSLDPVSELETIQYLRELIDGLPKQHSLKRYTGDPYYETGRLRQLFELMKKEDWSPAFLKEKIKAYLEDLPNREAYTYKRKYTAKDGTVFMPGDLKQALIDAEAGKMALLEAGVDLFEPYQEMLRKNNRYDFADMILWVIRAFRENSTLLADYQERFQYFLVDEYQDTSGSQNELLQLLLGYWDAPNIFAVGDDDQSIFRFQGANIENIRAFIDRYEKHLKLIRLEDNYRSTQPILDTAGRLIARNQQRIAADKTLRASHPERQLQQLPPAVHEYYNPAHESAAVGKQIAELHASGESLNEIAVLYRNHRQAEEMILWLRAQGIGVNSRRRANILEEPLVLKILRILEFLRAETTIALSGDPFLFEILHYEEFGIEPLEIARLAAVIRNSTFGDNPTGWRTELKKLLNAPPPDLFTAIATPSALKKAAGILENLISTALNQTPQETIHQLIRETGILTVALAGPEKQWHMEVLKTFTDFIKEECSRNPRYTLNSLCDLLLLMRDHEVSIPAEKVLYDENGVNFITAHSSKGLEFNHVFMIGCNRKAWDEAGRSRTFQLPDTLFSVNIQDEDEDSRRLFYVAMTRARKQLHISYCKFDLQQKEQEASRFIAEFAGEEDLSVRTEIVPEDALQDFLFPDEEKAAEAELPIEILEDAYTDRLLEKYSLSVTHLNNYLKCPVSFYFNNLIRVPSPRNASMTFGSAVHFALEQLFRKMNNDPDKSFPDKDQLMKDFRWYMRRHQDSFTEAEFKRRSEYAEEVLPRFYETYIDQWNKVTSIERSYRNVVVNGVPINGKLDKLEFDGNYVNVVDYKTGAFKKAKPKFKRPDAEACKEAEISGKTPSYEDRFGGDYWRQAVFYKIILDNDHTKKWEMRSSEFDFVEPEVTTGKNNASNYYFHKERVNITPEDVSVVTNQIVGVYRNILNKEFSKGCGEETCVWCNFTKAYYRNKTAIPGLGESEEEN